MTINRRQQVIAGAFLIALGLVWWLDLWFLLWPGALAAAGVAAYVQRRAMGRLQEAVQGGLWGVGLALLFLTGFVWPGLLFLAGASILLRGREGELDARVQSLLGRVSRRSAAIQPVRSQQVPVTTVTVEPVEPASVGETTRLR